MQNTNLPVQFRLENIREYLVTLWNGETHEILAPMAGAIAKTEDKNAEFADSQQGFYFKKSAVASIKKIRDAKKEVARYIEKQKRLQEEREAEELAKKQKIALEKFEKENPQIRDFCKKKAEEYIKKYSKVPSSAVKNYYKVFMREEYKKLHNIS